jgi:SAM-dependent methyltransferase
MAEERSVSATAASESVAGNGVRRDAAGNGGQRADAGDGGAGARAGVMRMYQFIYGNWLTMITYVYAELDLARLLRESPKTVAELADATRTNPRALARFLRCAGALGFHMADSSAGRLALTDFGSLLCTDSPVSLRAAARLNGAPYRYQPWGRLLEYVRAGTGRGLSPTWEEGSLSYLKDKPELLEVFEEAMTDLSRTAYGNVDENRVIAESFDFARFRSVLDIGCGNGSLVEAILLAHPALRGALFDLDDVLDGVALPSAGHPNAGRVEKIPGDYSRAVPAGFDAYITKNVIHNLPEHKCRTLLRNVRRAMLADGAGARDRRLVMFELMMPDAGEGDLMTKLVDLNMSLLLDGSDRTAEDYESLLGECGFELLRVHDLPGLERKAIETAVAA